MDQGPGTHCTKMGADSLAENTKKIPQMPQNLSAQFVCPSPKVPDFNEKRLHWASVVCGCANSWRHTLHKKVDTIL